MLYKIPNIYFRRNICTSLRFLLLKFTLTSLNEETAVAYSDQKKKQVYAQYDA